MGLSKYLMAAAAATMAASPVVAAPANAPVRAATQADGEQLRGGFIIPILALIAIIAGIILLARNNNSTPSSP